MTSAQSEILTPELLIIGGDKDPNLIRLMQKCGERAVHFHACLQGDSGTPQVIFDVGRNTLVVNGRQISPKAVFIRADVFRHMEDGKLETWHEANDWYLIFFGWLIANPQIRVLNRNNINRPMINKLAVLLMAKQIGMDIPETYFTNTVSFMNQHIAEGNWIRKPVDGGDACHVLTRLPPENYPSNRTRRPLIMQESLNYPELRLFRIGKNFSAYHVMSEDLDYRESPTARLQHYEVPEALAAQLTELTDLLGLDYCAADFKTCKRTGKFLLLEVNSAAMFAGFDATSNGELITFMLDELIAS